MGMREARSPSPCESTPCDVLCQQGNQARTRALTCPSRCNRGRRGRGSRTKRRNQLQGDISMVEKEMGSRKAYGRLIGALFLAGILVYGVGFQLVSSITSEPDFVSTISAQQTVLVLGAFLMLLNTV